MLFTAHGSSFFYLYCWNLTQPMILILYILKRFGGSEMGVLRLKNHPLRRNQVRLEVENGMLLA
jgi:hypothetical protein